MLGIKVLPKDQNTPFVPQLRPIERVWAELKRRLFANGWTAEKTLELREKNKKDLRKALTTGSIDLMLI
jgi:hypothetical protein